MSVLLVAGRRANHILRATSIVMTPVADTNFPASNLQRGVPSVVTLFGSVATDPKAVVDLNQVVNGGAETGTLDGWTTAGTVIADTVQKNTGTYSFKLTGTTGLIQQDISWPSGQPFRLSWALRGDAVTGVARIRLYNPLTGRYWNGTTWTTSPTDLDTQSAASFKTGFTTGTIEPFRTTLADETTIRIIGLNNTAGSAWIDDVYMNPGSNFSSIHGSGYDPLLALELHSSTDNFAANDTTQATFSQAVSPLAFYKSLPATVYDRYWMLKGTGTPVNAPWVGTWALAQAVTLASGQVFPMSRSVYTRAQSRGRTVAGNQSVRNLGSTRRNIEIAFNPRLTADMQQVREYLVERSQLGANPLIVAETLDPELCVLGRTPEGWRIQQNSFNTWDSDSFPIEEEAVSQVTRATP